MQGLGDGVGTAAGFTGEQRDAEVRSEQADLRPEASHRRAGTDEALSVQPLGRTLGGDLTTDGTKWRDAQRCVRMDSYNCSIGAQERKLEKSCGKVRGVDGRPPLWC